MGESLLACPRSCWRCRQDPAAEASRSPARPHVPAAPGEAWRPWRLQDDLCCPDDPPLISSTWVTFTVISLLTLVLLLLFSRSLSLLQQPPARPADDTSINSCVRDLACGLAEGLDCVLIGQWRGKVCSDWLVPTALSLCAGGRWSS